MDNNATTEQQNRLDTRFSKNASLIEGVNKLVTGAIADKGRFNMVVAGKNVNKGPTSEERKIRVEKANKKVVVDAVESLEQMVSIRKSGGPSNLKGGDFKKEALETFKSKMSDTHRSDKLRKAQKQIVAKPKKFL